MPYRVVLSPAWRDLSQRARCVLDVILTKHNGYNNGRIAISIRDLSHALGAQNYGANGKAVAELIGHGFLEAMSAADRFQQRSREYRITFISTGESKKLTPATHEYLEWRPNKKRKRKFGAAETASRTGETDAETASQKKLTDVETAGRLTESRDFQGGVYDAETAAHISSHPNGEPFHPKTSTIDGPNSGGPKCCRSVEELRLWTIDVVAHLGYGGQKTLALSSNVPEAIISKFRNGRNLPQRYHHELQIACARVIGFKIWLEGQKAKST